MLSAAVTEAARPGARSTRIVWLCESMHVHGVEEHDASHAEEELKYHWCCDMHGLGQYFEVHAPAIGDGDSREKSIEE